MPGPLEEVFDDIFEKLADLIHVESRQLRLFTIAEVDDEGLRIKYEYETGEISHWHPWASVTSRAHHPPVVGETCMLVMQHGDPALSVALCGIRYTAGKDGRGPDCHGNADVLQGAYRYDRNTGELRLGTSSPDAEVVEVAEAPKVKAELDAIKVELDSIKTTLDTLTGGAQAPAKFLTPYQGGYSPSPIGAAKVKVGS